MRRQGSADVLSAVLATAGLTGGPTTGAAAVVAPAGFSDTLAYSLPAPTGMAWTPDGRMLISQDAGQLRVVQNGTLLATPAINLGSRACVQGERGLQSVAVDPAFATNKWIYLFWTYNRHGFCGAGDMSRTPVNRVARYTLGADNRVVAGSEKVLVDNIPSPASHHNGGDIHFGSDGHLYVSTGDGGCTIGDTSRCNELNVNSRRLDIPNGKILRVTKAGGIPDGNPYAGRTGARRCTAPTGVQPGTGPCTETYASGLRNPYRFAKKPAGGFLVNDVGQAHWEEIDNLAAGKNYGWNVREGHCARGSYTDCAATSYQNRCTTTATRAAASRSPAAAYVPAGVWPAPYSGSYLFADFVCGKVFRLVPRSVGGYDRAVFLSGLSSPTVLAFGPWKSAQALYYVDYFGNTVHRVTYTGSNAAPTAAFTARPNDLPVAFDGSASYDPDAGDSITSYRWDFGDGTSATTATPTTTHAYAARGSYTATLRVTDSRGATSTAASKTVYAGEHAPTVSFTSPATTDRFGVGQSVSRPDDDADDDIRDAPRRCGARPAERSTRLTIAPHAASATPISMIMNGCARDNVHNRS